MSAHQHHAFAPDLESVARARHFVASAIPPAVLEIDADLLDIAQLLTSELVSNAVLHAGTDFEVDVHLDDTGDDVAVVISVRDGSTRWPILRSPERDAPGGRGVFLIAQLSARWGVEAHDAGKCVWCRLEPHATRTERRGRALRSV